MTDSVSTVRQPRQRRSRASFERVLESAAVLLEENSVEGFTVQEVAGSSGVSVGAIYERFGNKESLLRAVHGRWVESVISDNEMIQSARNTEQPAAEAVTGMVVALARMCRRHKKILRPFMHLAAFDSEIEAEASRQSIEMAHVFKSALLAHRTEIVHPDPDLAIDIAFRMVYCTFARQVMYGPTFESDRRIPWKQLTEQASMACNAYLLQPTPA